MLSDEVLMLQFQAGSRDSFEELFARYQNVLYGFFRRRVESKSVAEDLAQETWVAVFRSAVRYQPRAPFRAYLYGIAFRLLAAERRKNRREETDLLTRVPAVQPSETDCWIREALAKLDSTEREILMLREYEQLSYLEIAGLLHMPVNTVRSRLFRARRAFRDFLEPDTAKINARGRS